MIHTSGLLPDDRTLCYYVNETGRVQLARITNIPDWWFERVVFPGQRLLFEAVPHAVLEIHVCAPDSLIPLKQIPCLDLQVKEN
jgi:hypothetical protein